MAVCRTLAQAALIWIALLVIAGAPTAGAAAGQVSPVIVENFSLGAVDFKPIRGGTWAASGGVYNLTQPAQPTATTGAHANMSLHMTGLDGPIWDLSARSRVTGTASKLNDLSLIFGFVNEHNYSYASFNESNNTTTNGLFTVVDGRQTEVADFSEVISSGRYYALRVAHAGGLVTASVDGRSVGQAAMTIPAGLVGLGTHDDGASFDDVASTVTGSQVNVSNATQLKAALAAAEPGHVVQLADGMYSGRFVIARAGTASEPITLRGSRNAVIDAGSLVTGTGLYVNRVSDWRLEGFTVSNALKGILVDGSTRLRIDGVEVRQTGDEGIHLRAFSSDNVIRNSLVRQTGLDTPGYGEGIYVGSAVTNWPQHSGGQPDRSDRNQILDNVITETKGESIDIKEGSTGGVIRGNSFDGSAMTGEHYADSWIDAKGNGYLIEGNRGENAYADGFQTHVQLDGWGQDNVFRNNVAIVDGPGYGFNINRGSRATVGCDNVVQGAAKGFANIGCTP